MVFYLYLVYVSGTLLVGVSVRENDAKRQKGSEIGIMHCHDGSTTSMTSVMTWQVQDHHC